jgi:hypothetical protein
MTVSVEINEKTLAKYELEKLVSLNAMGNYYRGVSIHRDVLETIDELGHNNHDFNCGDVLNSKKHKTRIRIIESED